MKFSKPVLIIINVYQITKGIVMGIRSLINLLYFFSTEGVNIKSAIKNIVNGNANKNFP